MNTATLNGLKFSYVEKLQNTLMKMNISIYTAK